MCCANAVAVFEVELVRPAFFGRQRGHVSVPDGIAEDAGAKFLVDQDAGACLRHAAAHRLPEAFVDDPLAIDDVVVLRLA